MIRNLWAAGFLLLLGVAGTVESWRLALGDFGKPGAGFFPFYLALGLLITSLALIVQSLLARNTEIKSSPGSSGAKEAWKVVWALLGLFLYAFVFEKTGFLLSTFSLMVFYFRTVAAFGWLLTLGGALATALLSHLIFKVWLEVQLPAGPWGL